MKKETKRTWIITGVIAVIALVLAIACGAAIAGMTSEKEPVTLSEESSSAEISLTGTPTSPFPSSEENSDGEDTDGEDTDGEDTDAASDMTDAAAEASTESLSPETESSVETTETSPVQEETVESSLPEVQSEA